MFLLTILISLALEKFVPALDRLRGIQWFHRYAAWLRKTLQGTREGRGSLTVLTTVLPPVLLVGGAQYLLNEMLWLFSFLLSLVVLVYALGPRDMQRQVQAYLAAREKGDEREEQAVLQKLLPFDVPTSGVARMDAVLDMIFVLTHERAVAVFFWFVLLGPMGAIFYRLVSELITRPPQGVNADYCLTISRLHMVLAWLPAHLSALSFALVGSFAHALHAWRETSIRDVAMLPVCHQYVVRTGRAALQLEELSGEEAIRQALALCQRSLISWVTILALLTLSGQVF